MSEPSTDHRRGSPRVGFRAPIRILSEDRSQDCWASSTNLSTTGIHLSSMETFSVGSELGVDLPLLEGDGASQGDQSLAFRCRVVWVERERRCGVGLEFLDLSDDERHSLHHLVDSEDQHSDWTRPVKIWFDGQPMPMIAQAIPGKDKLVVGIELPYLKQLSQVTYRFMENQEEEGEGETGTLVSVYLEPGPVPRLMATIRPEEGANHTITTWPPHPDLFEQGLTDEQEIQPQQQTGSVEAKHEPVSPDRDIATDLPLEEMKSGEFFIQHRSGAAEPKSGESFRSVEIKMDDEMEDLVEYGEAKEDWDQSFHRLRQLDGPGARNIWLWVAAVFMTGMAVAAMSYTGLFDRVQSSSPAQDDRGSKKGLATAPATPADQPPPAAVPPTQPKPDAPLSRPDSQAPEPDVLLTRPDSRAPKPDAPPLRPDAVSPKPAAVAKPAPSPRSTPDPSMVGNSTHLPGFSAVSGGTRVVFPIRGSSAGIKHFSIEEPYGISINLPNAQPSHRFGNFRIRNQKLFRLLWVKKRRGGLHLRLFFKVKKSLPYQVDLSSGKVVVTVKE